MRALVRRFVDERQIRRLEDLKRWGYEPTSKQRPCAPARPCRSCWSTTTRAGLREWWQSGDLAQAVIALRHNEARRDHGAAAKRTRSRAAALSAAGDGPASCPGLCSADFFAAVGKLPGGSARIVANRASPSSQNIARSMRAGVVSNASDSKMVCVIDARPHEIPRRTRSPTANFSIICSIKSATLFSRA